MERPAQPYVTIDAIGAMDDIGQVVPPLNGEVFRWLADHGATPSGPPFWKYNVVDMARTLEIEAGVTVAEPMSSDGRIAAGTLPAGRYATLRHTGHPSTLVEATRSLLDWAAERRLAWDVAPSPDGDRWAARLELYLTDPQTEPDMSKWVTKLAFRLADRQARPAQ